MIMYERQEVVIFIVRGKIFSAPETPETCKIPIGSRTAVLIEIGFKRMRSRAHLSATMIGRFLRG
jgi:hypothetical protein